ncbi:MAG: putative glycoside hydrolase [Patescibacteria group bacterium]
MRYFFGFFILAIVGGSVFFVLTKEKMVEISQNLITDFQPQQNNEKPIDKNADIEPQKPLANPPKEIKAIYLTAWSAGNSKKVDEIIKLIKDTELNAVVIDIKDYSGYVAYDIDIPEVKKYKARKIMISKINSLIKKLHDENIYIIARITVFQDPVLAKARPDLAIKSRKTDDVWLDRKKLAWIDPTAKEAWDYNISIAKDAANRGFDELNFDYIRFASDGNLNDMAFPFWDRKTQKQEVIKSFFQYLREQLAGIKISADLFGLSTIQSDDLVIGQIIESAYQYFDYVAPMVYPSHYAKGFLGYKNPADYPYEVIKYSMEHALNKLIIQINATSTQVLNSKLRPWLQDFDLGAKYDAKMVKEQMRAVYDAASTTPELINGWMLWDPSNTYMREALNNE